MAQNIVTFGNKQLYLINKDDNIWHIISYDTIIGMINKECGIFMLFERDYSRTTKQHKTFAVKYLIDKGFHQVTLEAFSNVS